MTARCPVKAGSDRCERERGHAGDHESTWTPHVVMRWRGNEPWSHGPRHAETLTEP